MTDPVEIALRVLQSPRMSNRMKGALWLVMEGASYREAARLAGLRNHRDLFRHAQRHGVAALHRERREALLEAKAVERLDQTVESLYAGEFSPSELLKFARIPPPS